MPKCWCLQAFLDRKKESSGNKNRVPALDDPSKQLPLNKNLSGRPSLENQVNVQLSLLEVQAETQSDEPSALGHGSCGNHCVLTAMNDASEDAADELKLLITSKLSICLDDK